jgi:hypothetical protein
MNIVLKNSFVYLKSLNFKNSSQSEGFKKSNRFASKSIVSSALRYSFIQSLLISLLCSCSSFQSDQSTKIVGEWSGNAKSGEKVTLIFEKDKSASFISNNQVMDSTTSGGKVSWELDTTKDPIHLDIVFTTRGEKKIMPLIMRYLGERKIMIRIGDKGIRPTSFTMESVENQIVLDKK